MIFRGNFIFYLPNTTAGLAILTSISYFSAGLSKKGRENIYILCVLNLIFYLNWLFFRILYGFNFEILENL